MSDQNRIAELCQRLWGLAYQQHPAYLNFQKTYGHLSETEQLHYLRGICSEADWQQKLDAHPLRGW